MGDPEGGLSRVAGPSRLPPDDATLPPYTPSPACPECTGCLLPDYVLPMPPDPCSTRLLPTPDSKSTISDATSTYMPICRICHESAFAEDLISPCRCAGSLGFIHNTCLMKWLTVRSKHSRKPPKCELCHYQFHRHKQFKFHHWQFPHVSRSDIFLHSVFICMLLVMIVCAVATVMCFISDKGQINTFPRNKVDLTTEEIVTLACGVLFFVSFFVAMTVEIKAKHTVYQLLIKFITHNMEWEIYEYDKSKDSMFKKTTTTSAIYTGPPIHV